MTGIPVFVASHVETTHYVEYKVDEEVLRPILEGPPMVELQPTLIEVWWRRIGTMPWTLRRVTVRGKTVLSDRTVSHNHDSITYLNLPSVTSVAHRTNVMPQWLKNIVESYQKEELPNG